LSKYNEVVPLNVEKTGTWKDGPILIKELVSVGCKAAVSGNGYFMGDVIGQKLPLKVKNILLMNQEIGLILVLQIQRKGH
jgi:hypothetical protein